MRQRGVLFTIGLAFYCAGLLTLVLVFIDHTEKVRATGNDASQLIQIDSTYSSIERSMDKIFNTSSGVTLKIGSSTITISEELPNPYAADYRNAASALKLFAEKNLKEGGLAIDLETSESTNHMSTSFDPYGIILNHTDYGSGELSVTAEQINFDSYTVTLIIPEEVSCSSSIVSGSDFDLNIDVIGNSETACTLAQSINATASSQLLINNGSAMINFTNMTLRIQSSIVESLAELRIDMDDFSGKEPKVYLYDILSVSSKELPMSKISRIRIA